MVTSDAIEPISTTMKSTKEWTQIYVSRQLVMHECQRIKMEFKGEIQLTVNQMSPTMRFYSRRWQGHQVNTVGQYQSVNISRSELQCMVLSLYFLPRVDCIIKLHLPTFKRLNVTKTFFFNRFNWRQQTQHSREQRMYSWGGSRSWKIHKRESDRQTVELMKGTRKSVSSRSRYHNNTRNRSSQRK